MNHRKMMSCEDDGSFISLAAGFHGAEWFFPMAPLT